MRNVKTFICIECGKRFTQLTGGFVPIGIKEQRCPECRNTFYENSFKKFKDTLTNKEHTNSINFEMKGWL